MKIRLGKKRGGDDLRPLTEKEIQERLYGRYRRETALKEDLDVDFPAPPQRERAVILGPSVRSSASIPWRNWLSSGRRGWGSVLGGLQGLLQRTGRGVGVGLIVLGVLFVAIQTLNTYRTEAIREQKTRPRRESPLKQPTPAAEVKTERIAEALPPTPPLERAVAPELEKRYVIQICTYAREEDAQRLVGNVQQAQFPAFVQARERANGKTFYPVFIGRFETFQQAQKKLQEFRSKPISNDFPDSFVRAL